MRKGVFVLSMLLVFMMPVVFAIDIETCSFMLGDSNGDEIIDISDAVFTLRYLFKGGLAPDCIESADVNGDESIDLSDVVYFLQFLFQGGSDLVSPSYVEQEGIGFLITDRYYLNEKGDYETQVYFSEGADVVGFIGVADKLYRGCEIYINSYDSPGTEKLINEANWENIGGKNLQINPYSILLKSTDFLSGRYLLRAECTDNDGRLENTKVVVSRVSVRLENLGFDEQNGNEIELLDDPGNAGKTGCCEIICTLVNKPAYQITRSTCAQTTESECHSVYEGQECPAFGNEACNKYFKKTYPDVRCSDTLWHAEDTCVDPDGEGYKYPQCYSGLSAPGGSCEVEAMTILYMPEHEQIPELPIPKHLEFVQQTFPLEPNQNQYGHVEGLVLANPSTGKFNPVWSFGWRFAVYAKLKKGSDPDACGEAQFIQNQFTSKPTAVPFTKGSSVKGFEYLENDILKKLKIKDLKLPDYDVVVKNSIMDNFGGAPRGCYVDSQILCADDYINPRDFTKLHDKKAPAVMWYDLPSAYIPLSQNFVESNPTTKLKNKATGVEFAFPNGPIKKESFLQRVFTVYPFVESSDGKSRFYCQLRYIVWNSRDMAQDIGIRKTNTYPPDCKCVKQEWEVDHWKDVKETYCGWEGLNS